MFASIRGRPPKGAEPLASPPLSRPKVPSLLSTQVLECHTVSYSVYSHISPHFRVWTNGVFFSERVRDILSQNIF